MRFKKVKFSLFFKQHISVNFKDTEVQHIATKNGFQPSIRCREVSIADCGTRGLGFETRLRPTMDFRRQVTIT